MKLEFCGQIFLKSNFMKICVMGAKFHADGHPQAYGWTDLMKIIVPFLSFLNAPKNVPE
jgi:hypothetical protein